MTDEYASEIIELTCRLAYERATPLERVIWVERVVRQKKFAVIAEELNLTSVHVRRTWFRFLERISEDVRFAAMADQRLREVLRSSLSDPDAFTSILGGLLAFYPPRL